MPLRFQYYANDLDTIILDSTSSPGYLVFLSNGPFTLEGKSYANTRLNVMDIVNGGNNAEATYQFNVSDVSNNTLGVLQYSFNFIEENADVITTVPQLTGHVSFATGIFVCYPNASVLQTFDNVSGLRQITITREKK
jgi:hypothetical protein